MQLDFNEYQKRASKTAIYPNIGKNLTYPVIGLCGETGELANKFGKTIRDSNGIVTEDAREEMLSELGDILWFLSQTCTELNCTLEDVAEQNLDKLTLRKENDTINGRGDDR